MLRILHAKNQTSGAHVPNDIQYALSHSFVRVKYVRDAAEQLIISNGGLLKKRYFEMWINLTILCPCSDIISRLGQVIFFSVTNNFSRVAELEQGIYLSRFALYKAAHVTKFSCNHISSFRSSRGHWALLLTIKIPPQLHGVQYPTKILGYFLFL